MRMAVPSASGSEKVKTSTVQSLQGTSANGNDLFGACNV